MILLSLGWFASWNIYLPLIVVALVSVYHYFGKARLLWPAVILTCISFTLFRTMETTLAVGCSFYLLILLGYTIDVIHRKSEVLPWDETLLMGSFFPLMMSGPVVRSDSFAQSLREDRLNWDSFFDGGLIFSLGFLKFMLLNEGLSDLTLLWRNDYSIRGVLLSSLFVTVSLYVSLSSFADMGRGIARAFGIMVTPSFRPISFARNPSDFWERWNHTVAGWFRDYLVFPSLLRWGRKIPGNLIVFGAFVILGIWHGFEVQWLLFGVFNGLMVMAGSYLPGRILVFLMLIGNGFFHIAGDVLSKMRYEPHEIETGIWFYAGVFLLVVMEICQERLQENDFFLSWPRSLKRTIVIALFLAWVILGEHREPIDPEALPLYFDL